MKLSSCESIWTGKRHVSYSARILSYCREHDIAVPSGFHGRTAHKIAVVDVTAIPHKLIAVTWYLPTQVHAYLSRATSAGREFRVLNFKTGRELWPSPDGKLQTLGTFNCHKDADFIH